MGGKGEKFGVPSFSSYFSIGPYFFFKRMTKPKLLMLPAMLKCYGFYFYSKSKNSCGWDISFSKIVQLTTLRE